MKRLYQSGIRGGLKMKSLISGKTLRDYILANILLGGMRSLI